MTATDFIYRASISAIFLAVVLSGCGGDKPTDPPPVEPLPEIELFSGKPLDITPADSTILTWKVSSADSVILFPGGISLTPTDSGQLMVKPVVPRTYQIIAYNKKGQDSANISITMLSAASSITEFTFLPDTIVQSDSTILIWKSNQADSLIIDNGIGKVSNTDSGQVKFVPSNSQTYKAITFSIYGNDTAQTSIAVRIPSEMMSINGTSFKGIMGTSQITPQLLVGIDDQNNTLINDIWIYLELLTGDGILSPADSVLTKQNGQADLSYEFNGLLGNALIRARYKSVDTIDLVLRSDMLNPGVGGQAQYILFTDSLNNVKNFNGNPNSIDIDPSLWLTYANYESTLGVVFVIDDTTRDEIAQDFEDVFAIILTSTYTGKTKDSIGIGSTLNEIKAVYGLPDTIYLDTVQPPALGIVYSDEGMLFFIDTVAAGTVDTNTAAFEIHMDDFISTPAPAVKRINQTASFENYRRSDYRRYRK
ncbi:MAG: hypothetical protein IIA17_11415 [candidate division Zixibacteria bacterium]|nr:hypothetical protein [candidate division Zixibacteria bacterium]